VSVKGLFTKKVLLVNENIVHLVDDEKVRDEAGRMIALRSVAPYALCTHNVEKFFGFPPEQVSAFAMTHQNHAARLALQHVQTGNKSSQRQGLYPA
jgi:hypothetical protein